MMLAKCVVLELRHRPIAALLSVVGLSLAVAYTVSLVMTEAANERETRRTMRNLGFNVRIVPRTTDQTQLLIDGYSRQTMPMNTIDRLAAASDIAYNHLVATLKTRSSVAGHDCFITGLSGTRFSDR